VNVFGEKGGAGGRQARKEETRARILEAARGHFEAEGFEGASVRAIGREAGVAAGTVLLHFRDKRDLLHAALFDDLAAVIERAVAPREGEALGSLQQELERLAGAFFGYYRARPTLSKTLLREALLAESPWRERFTEQVGRVHAHVARLAARAHEAGELSADVDGAVLGAAFFSFYYFALIAWVQGEMPPEPLFERLLSQHLAGRVTPLDPTRRKER